MIYGYARASTSARDLTSQLAELKAAGCERMFRKKITGTTIDRPQLKKLMAVVPHGDMVVISAVERLSRDMTDLLMIARDTQREAQLRIATGETQHSIALSYNVN